MKKFVGLVLVGVLAVALSGCNDLPSTVSFEKSYRATFKLPDFPGSSNSTLHQCTVDFVVGKSGQGAATPYASIRPVAGDCMAVWARVHTTGNSPMGNLAVGETMNTWVRSKAPAGTSFAWAEFHVEIIGAAGRGEFRVERQSNGTLVVTPGPEDCVGECYL